MKIAKLYTAEQFYKDYCQPEAKILNAGSGNTRYGENCVNIDCVAGPYVDVTCSLHLLGFNGDFDAVICNAVLQYCRFLGTTIGKLTKALKPGGLIFIDVPFVQPLCDCGDSKDLWRFSEAGLRQLFEIDFEILACGASIRPGDALSFMGIKIAKTANKNKIVNYVLGKIVRLALLPLCWIKTATPTACAGAVYLIGRKR